MANTTLDLQTLFAACRNLEKYYGGAAELVGNLGWQPGVSPITRVPGISSEVADVVGLIAEDDPMKPPCTIWPHCLNSPANLVSRLEAMNAQAQAMTAALQALAPYFGPRPDLTGLLPR